MIFKIFKQISVGIHLMMVLLGSSDGKMKSGKSFVGSITDLWQVEIRLAASQ